MSELNRPTAPAPATPASAPTSAPNEGAAEVYRRAVEARPTGFTENPLGAMANAMDRIGRAAGRVVSSRPLEGQDGLEQGEATLREAVAKMRANPGSLQAKQGALRAALQLLRQMEGLAPNDPRRLTVARFTVGLAGQLGAAGIPFTAAGLDVRGLLRSAAQTLSRFGTPGDMQAAFGLEGLLSSSMPGSSVAAVRLRDALMLRFGLSGQAQALIANGWAVREAKAGEVPRLDMSARTMVLDAAQSNPSLGVLARAYWLESSARSPTSKEGFVDAFLKVAAHGGLPVLSRRYREVRAMARRELQQGRMPVLGASGAAGSASTAPGSASPAPDDSADMFAALAVFSRSPEAGELPDAMREPLAGFIEGP